MMLNIMPPSGFGESESDAVITGNSNGHDDWGRQGLTFGTTHGAGEFVGSDPGAAPTPPRAPAMFVDLEEDLATMETRI